MWTNYYTAHFHVRNARIACTLGQAARLLLTPIFSHFTTFRILCDNTIQLRALTHTLE